MALAAAYHAYKIGLANDFSLSSLHGMQAYCSAANTAFDTALNPESNRSLARGLPLHAIGARRGGLSGLRDLRVGRDQRRLDTSRGQPAELDFAGEVRGPSRNTAHHSRHGLVYPCRDDGGGIAGNLNSTSSLVSACCPPPTA
jgi:hypothetical protein